MLIETSIGRKPKRALFAKRCYVRVSQTGNKLRLADAPYILSPKTRNEITAQQHTVLDAVARFMPRLLSLCFRITVQHQIYRAVANGMRCNLPTSIMRQDNQLLKLFRRM